MKKYKVSEVSAIVGVPPATLRLWEQHGLVEPSRSPGGFRLYGEHDLERFRQIIRLRSEMGLNLAAIRSSLNGASERQSVRLAEDVSSLRLGHEIRRRRKERGLTIAQLAKKVDVSTSVLSTLERTSQGASIRTLRLIADALGVTVTDLVTPPQELPTAVVRSGHGRKLCMGAGIEVWDIAFGPRKIDCQEWLIAPGVGSEGFYTHAGEEFVRVLEGSLEIEVDGLGRAILGPGDSIYFKSDKAHSWRSVGRIPCRVLWMNTTPSSF